MYDPYQILGVSPDASMEEIRKAYTALAMQYHPDKNPGDREAARRMDEINNAYDIVRDPAMLARLGEMTKDGRLRGKGGAAAARAKAPNAARSNEEYNNYVQRVFGKTFIICVIVFFIVWIFMRLFGIGLAEPAAAAAALL